MNRLRGLAALLFVTALCTISASAQNLKLLVSVQQQTIVAPNPVRATLHLHNSGQKTLWLYRPVRSKQTIDQGNSIALEISGRSRGPAYGGSMLEVQLEAASSTGNTGTKESGGGFVIAPDALPYPRLVHLAPGKNYEEKVNIHVEPAKTKANGGSEPAWGQYRFSMTYSADYSNQEALARAVNTNLWHGHVSSNTVMLNLQAPTAQGSITGTVVDSIGHPSGGDLVTLSNGNEDAINQLYSDVDGRFAFAHLPFGRYWLTVRQPGSAYDTSVFRQVDLNQTNSPATVQIMMLPVKINRASRMLHKPVLFHIVDGNGHPLAGVKLIILRTTGDIIENLKRQTDEDGFLGISLIPGPNFVTLRRSGCKKEDRRADVASGPGVDGFTFTYDCSGR